MLKSSHPLSERIRMKIAIPHSSLTVLAATMFLLAGTAAADNAPLFESHTTLQVRIEAPISTLRRDRSEDEYLEGKFLYVDAAGVQQSLDLKLRPRGRFRKQREICNFPPLRLNFRKKQVRDTLFDGQDKLKLVTHCKNSSENYEQNLLQEYLAYRIFNSVTDQSFRVRLMQVTYADTDRDGAERTGYAFLIEDDDSVADRLGMQASKIRKLRYEQLDADQTVLFTIFQYMIGNTDFSAVLGSRDDYCCHNAILLTNGIGKFVAVPYDFDFSGIVDAPYAAPGKQFKIKSVKQRVYRGLCTHNEMVQDTIEGFQEQDPAIRRLINELDGMSSGTRSTTQTYIDGFYEDVSSPERIQQNMIKECSLAQAPAEPPSASPR